MLEYLPSFERGILANLRLNASDAARVCGITPRQLKYWTVKGFVPTVDDSEHCYDLKSMQKAILIRRVMGEGYTLEMANKMVNKLIVEEIEEEHRVAGLGDSDLKREIGVYLDELERHIASTQEDLPTYLTLSGFGEIALPADKRALEQFFRANPHSFDTAPNLALRLGHPAGEVDRLLEELARAGVLVRSEGDMPIYRLRQ